MSLAWQQPVEPDMDRCREQKKPREVISSRSAEDLTLSAPSDENEQSGPSCSESDARDLLQLALDRICELQRKLMQRGDDIPEPQGGHDADTNETEDEDSDASDNSFHDQEVVLAGYEFCHKEALRFLVEEEHLGPEHPAVRELTAHLAARRSSMDCTQILANYLLLPSQSSESINV